MKILALIVILTLGCHNTVFSMHTAINPNKYHLRKPLDSERSNSKYRRIHRIMTSMSEKYDLSEISPTLFDDETGIAKNESG